MGDVIQGPWPAKSERPEIAPAFEPQWASQRRLSEAERVAQILAAKPHCAKCGVMFHPEGYVPADLVCLSCCTRPLHEAPADPPADPSLF